MLRRRERGIPLSIKERKRWRICGFVELSRRRRAGPRPARSQDDFFNGLLEAIRAADSVYWVGAADWDVVHPERKWK
ncbi:MAG: hypothetical protein J7M14_04295 [Planctomycetes bacterium]|nr:hypothetical protein [Planctomycetota bacterium]